MPQSRHRAEPGNLHPQTYEAGLDALERRIELLVNNVLPNPLVG